MRIGLKLIPVLASIAWVQSAVAQVDPWLTYSDIASASRCSVVNAANAELVVSSLTGNFILVTATDLTLVDYVVDVSGFVFYGDELVGQISFAQDGDGFRTLWWLTLTGTVMQIDPLTVEPSATQDTPLDYVDVPCDACDYWDDPTVCEQNVITVPLCGVDVPITIAMIAIGMGLAGLDRRRRSAFQYELPA